MGPLNSAVIESTSNSRLPDVDFNNLDFGKYISDHMFQVLYEGGTWKQPKVIPYGNLSFSPAMLALHYGQAVFEGMKAYRTKDGNISIFRVDKHFQRFNKSLERMCMPTISEELFIGGLHTLLATDQNWVPSTEGSSLYIRPVMFATEAKLGVKISEQYQFIIMTTPVGPYYTKSLRVKIEDTYVRASEGGVGFAKCAGNYWSLLLSNAISKTARFRSGSVDGLT